MRSEVLVVGGGPAGATAARFLSGNGIETILVESNLKHNKPCGGGIPFGALEDLDIPLKIAYKEVKALKVHFPSGRRIDIPLQGGSIVVVERGEFDPMLRAIAKEQGTHIIEGTFLSLREDGNRIISEVSVNGVREEIVSDFLIAADGVNSRVRRSLGEVHPGYIYTLSAGIRGRSSDACEFWFGNNHAPGTYSWIFPKTGSLSVGTGTGRPREARVSFERFVRRAGIEVTDDLELRGYRVPVWQAGLCQKGRVLFVGDAASQVMPFVYEGIYYAMKSGQFAAEALIRRKPSLYRKLWRGRFYSRFNLMKKLQDTFLKNDGQIEKLYGIFSRKEFQEISMKLWLRKESGRRNLLSYINLFRKFLH